MSENTTAKKTGVDKLIDGIEKVCNKLPPPAILFCWLFLITAIIGCIFSVMGVALTNPASGEVVTSANLFSKDGVDWILGNMVKNFTGFAPLGLVITMTLGIGLCEESGMLISMLNSSLKNVPASMIPYVIAFVGTVGNIASDTAMVVIPPMAAIVYMGVGKHPVVGMMVGYAGAQAGFTANLMVAGTDTLLQGLTNDAIKAFIPDTTFQVDPTCNWFFMIFSTFLCAAVIGFCSVHMIEPRFGKYEGAGEAKLEEVTPQQKKGLNAAGLTAIIYIIIIAIGFFTGLLSGENGAFIGSPLLKGLIPILFVLFCLCGLAYGFTAGTFKNAVDVNKAMSKQMAAMGSYVLFCFFCGQFQGLFNWTKLGTLLAIAGADGLEAAGFTGIPLCVAFIILCSFVNIFVSSGSAKWAIFAPIFVPMFMLLGYHPGFTQLLYRIGDSPFNCWTPMSAYIWMILSVAQTKYVPDLKIGTLISNMIPMSIVLQIAWIIVVVIWMSIGLPFGPGVGVALPAGIL
ncbi:putative p-aminobenzoyl-glutamate transporter [Clostridium sp. CAG:81]|nr:putative p-aminobenzoyl-glutamate transporter [Clostridium sp. CAG:81]